MDDFSRYKDLFVSEANEHLEALQGALLTLENGYEDHAIDEAFRAAHSMKGMAGTLGLAGEAALSHAVEDELSHMRTTKHVDSALLARLLAATDALAVAVHALEKDLPPVALEPALAAIRKRDPTSVASTPNSFDATGNVPARFPEALHKLPAGGRGCLRVKLAARCIAPRARLLVVRRTIEALGPVADVEPGPNSWAKLNPSAGTPIHFLFSGVSSSKLLVERVQSVPDLDEVTIVDIAAPSEPQTRARSPTRESATVRVPVGRVDELLDRGGEIRIALAQVDQLLDDHFVGGRPYALTEAMVRLERESRELYDAALKLRTLPVSVITQRFARLVRDTANAMGVSVRLELAGEDTEVDRSVLEALTDPVMHLVKNAIGHGVEGPTERVASGKPSTAVVGIRFERVANGVIVEVSDDGRGIDRTKVVARAIEAGHLNAGTDADSLSENDVLALLTRPGFSTAATVTDVSGRGVGLDVVQARLNDIGGSIQIRSKPGVGSTVRLSLPPTLALVDALECSVDNDPLYIPVDAIVTSLELTDEMRASGQVTFRDTRAEVAQEAPSDGSAVPPVYRTVRLVDLDQLFSLRERQVPYATAAGPGGHSWAAPETTRTKSATSVTPKRLAFGVVVEKHGHPACLGVDSLGSREELVLKAVDVPGSGPRFVSGAAIRGDGRVGLVIDVPSVLAAPVAKSRSYE